MRYVEYDDQDGHHKLTEQEAIAAQREAVEGLRFKYATDEAALQDFLTDNWAWITDEPHVP